MAFSKSAPKPFSKPAAPIVAPPPPAALKDDAVEVDEKVPAAPAPSKANPSHGNGTSSSYRRLGGKLVA